MTNRNWLVLLMAGVLVFGFSMLSAAPAAKSEVKDSGVPQKDLDELAELLKAPKAKGRAAAMAEYTDKMNKLLVAGDALVAKYPDAKNLYKVYLQMVQAANFLGRYAKDKAAGKRISDLSKAIVASDADAKIKINPDMTLTMKKLQGETEEDAKVKVINAFVAKYTKAGLEMDALQAGINMASQMRIKSLMDTLADTLEARYNASEVKDPGAYNLLRKLRRSVKSPYDGKPFEAELTKLDGTKLSLPDDLKGKVLVIDFWATWCGPCIKSLPHVKKFYAKYKDKNVEIIGISFDKAGKLEALKEFVKENKMPWIQTYTGKGWSDPTGRKYGISGIPAVWVVGKDGKIFSTNARGNESAIVDQALAVGETKEKEEK